MVEKVVGYRDKETGFVKDWPSEDPEDDEQIEVWRAECGCCFETEEAALKCEAEEKAEMEKIVARRTAWGKVLAHFERGGMAT